MANTIKFKRGLSANRTTVTPASGEPLFDTDTKQLYVGDGATAGGIPVVKPITDKLGAVSGIATLDSNGKVPLTQINDAILGQVEYKGGWNATTNTPTLPAASTVKGNYYITTVSGTYNSIDFVVGDWVISDGTSWGKVDNTDAVSSVFGRTGVITAQSGDYDTFQVTENTNLYFTDARARSAMTGAISTVTTSNLTASRAMVSNASGKVAASAVTSTELGYLTGVTSAIQTQINAKEPTITAGTTSQYWKGNKTWATLDKAAVGLGNVENTALSTWAGSANITNIGTLTSGSVPWARLTNVPNINTTDTAQSITGLKTYETYPNFGLYPNKVWNGLSCFSDGAKAAKTYRKLFTMPASSASNKGVVTLKGVVSGYTFMQGKAEICIVFNSRDYARPVATVTGSLGLCDIEMYREADNSFTVYAVFGVGSAHPWNLTLSGDFSNSAAAATYSYDSSVETTATPTGAIEWLLSTGYITRSYINSTSNTGFVINSDAANSNASILMAPGAINRSILTSYSDTGLFKYRSFDSSGVEIDQPLVIDNITNGDVSIGVGSGTLRRVRLGNYNNSHSNMDPDVWDIAAKTGTGTNLGWNREKGKQKTTFINRVTSGTSGGYSFRWYEATTPTERNLLDIDYLGNATFSGKIIKSGGTTSEFLKANGDVDSNTYLTSEYFTGGVTTILTSNLTASRALVSDSSGKVAVSTVTTTEIGYLSGVTSAIQGQINFLKNTKIGSQNYTNAADDAVTFPTKVSRGIHFGRSNYGTTPTYYNYLMLLEAYNTKYATIGMNNAGWYVSPLTPIASEPAAYYTIMHSGNIEANVLATKLTGVTPVDAAIVAGDSIADAFGKTQGQINARNVTLYKSGVGVQINGTTETTLRSYTLPANTLSSTDILKITVHGYVNLNAAGTGTLCVKVGGNTFYTFTKTYGTDSDDCLELVLYVAGTRCTLTGSSYNDGLGVATTKIANRIASTTDFTISNDIVITAQGSVAANGASLDDLIIERA